MFGRAEYFTVDQIAKEKSGACSAGTACEMTCGGLETGVIMTNKKNPETLRSARWFAPDDLRAFGHRSRAMQMGYAPEEWKDRPVIAILNTWSDAQPCHMHFKSRVDDVKRGVLMAGGFPLELPALSSSTIRILAKTKFSSPNLKSKSTAGC